MLARGTAFAASQHEERNHEGDARDADDGCADEILSGRALDDGEGDSPAVSVTIGVQLSRCELMVTSSRRADRAEPELR